MVREGGVPFRFGKGINDYLYVENCAGGHVQCLEAMMKDREACRGKA